MARSVSELLPRPFGELTVDDVEQIVAAVGEERESLFFERKQRVTAATLAKSCAAFANTMGGLLLIGIADEGDALDGIAGPMAEPQVWVKDVLRGHLLPLPPFRARWLPLDDDRGVLLVLVEESTSTPHLLTRHGAIYVRNPGSSDPVPINDQRRLLDLTARGERAREQALARVAEVLGRKDLPYAMRHLGDAVPQLTLSLSATGTSSDFTAPLFDPGADLEKVRLALGDHDDTQNDARRAFWTQHSAGIERYTRPDYFPIYPDRIEGIEVWRDGTIAVLQGRIHRPGRNDEDELEHDEVLQDVLTEQIRRFLRIGLDVLLEFGAHGDAALGVALPAGRIVHWNNAVRSELGREVVVNDWMSLELQEDEQGIVAGEIVAEIRRALGVGPRP
jgi:hypothetical protein